MDPTETSPQVNGSLVHLTLYFFINAGRQREENFDLGQMYLILDLR
jgi:hypothetical protein